HTAALRGALPICTNPFRRAAPEGLIRKLHLRCLRPARAGSAPTVADVAFPSRGAATPIRRPHAYRLFGARHLRRTTFEPAARSPPPSGRAAARLPAPRSWAQACSLTVRPATASFHPPWGLLRADRDVV